MLLLVTRQWSALKNFVYEMHRSPQTPHELAQAAKRLKLDIAYVVEAGCHDGSDSIQWVGELGVFRLLAIEPDPVAHKLAEQRLSEYLKTQRIQLINTALSENAGILELSYIGKAGSGSTQVRTPSQKSNSNVTTSCYPLDDFYGSILDMAELGKGLLWLDVEGHAVSVLSGARKALNLLSLAKVEVEFSKMSSTRMSNWESVLKIMSHEGFLLYRADIHPGNFGDFFFVRKSDLNSYARIVDFYFRALSFFLRRILYPKLHPSHNT
jgi:FkbM family methyltransferase